MPLVPMIFAVPSYLALQLAATSAPRRETATSLQRSSAGSPLTVRLILVPAARRAQARLAVHPCRVIGGRKRRHRRILPRFVNTPIAAAAAAASDGGEPAAAGFRLDGADGSQYRAAQPAPDRASLCR